MYLRNIVGRQNKSCAVWLYMDINEKKLSVNVLTGSNAQYPIHNCETIKYNIEDTSKQAHNVKTT